MVKEPIETSAKLEVIKRLLEAGVTALEATSFVSAKAVPQMADAAMVIEGLKESGPRAGIYALIPNLTGAKLARAAGLDNVTMVISASVAHNQSNVGRSVAKSLEELSHIRERIPDLKVKLDVATSFGCPFIGQVPFKEVATIIDRAVELNIEEVVLCDTIGVANPRQVDKVLNQILERYEKYGLKWLLHFHNTRGLAAANTLAALKLGFSVFETAVGGLGGCPFVPGASGNMATEDLVFMLEEMGLKTGLNLAALVECSEYLESELKLTLDHKVNRMTMNKNLALRL
jgi:hydroxymethylglutaryl-CoA lyase